jgi:predicted component of type VI protein secretion system
MDDKERLRIVLRHLIEHNEGHSEDYRRWVDLARGAGLDEAAGLIEEAIDHMERAGEALRKTLDLIA